MPELMKDHPRRMAEALQGTATVYTVSRHRVRCCLLLRALLAATVYIVGPLYFALRAPARTLSLHVEALYLTPLGMTAKWGDRSG